MTTSIPARDIDTLSRANPDAVGPFAAGTASGRSTFLYGARNKTLYTDDRVKGTHNIVLHEHPEMVEEILPTEIFERYRRGEFSDPRRGGQTWEVVASFALLGRLGGIQAPGERYNVVSVWPRSRAGVPGMLEPAPGLLDAALPGLLRALKGEGEVRSHGRPARIDDDWVVVVEGELGPVTVGEFLARLAIPDPLGPISVGHDGKRDDRPDEQEAPRMGADDDDDDEEEEEGLMGYEGGQCTRCGLSLDEGYCPNDRCPFAGTYQDELVEDWTYPGEDERAHIAALRGRAED